MNFWGKVEGFERRRHLGASNAHAACSALVLALVAVYLSFAHRAALSGQFQAQRTCYIWATALAGFELIFNAPAIVLARYLYLLTLRRPGLDRGPRQALEGSHNGSA
jgi:hypothetical protein